MPSLADFQAMSPDDFERFWRLYLITFEPVKAVRNEVRMAIELRRNGWLFSTDAVSIFGSKWFHPAKHHTSFRLQIAHELDARGWLTAPSTIVKSPHLPFVKNNTNFSFLGCE